ncbi:MAG: hypothetical protein FWE01_03365 [Firmicutes bacterium]|nr:hypothetical protein [Bacillota bacterium]
MKKIIRSVPNPSEDRLKIPGDPGWQGNPNAERYREIIEAQIAQEELEKAKLDQEVHANREKISKKEALKWAYREQREQNEKSFKRKVTAVIVSIVISALITAGLVIDRESDNENEVTMGEETDFLNEEIINLVTNFVINELEEQEDEANDYYENQQEVKSTLLTSLTRGEVRSVIDNEMLEQLANYVRGMSPQQLRNPSNELERLGMLATVAMAELGGWHLFNVNRHYGNDVGNDLFSDNADFSLPIAILETFINREQRPELYGNDVLRAYGRTPSRIIEDTIIPRDDFHEPLLEDYLAMAIIAELGVTDFSTGVLEISTNRMYTLSEYIQTFGFTDPSNDPGFKVARAYYIFDANVPGSILITQWAEGHSIPDATPSFGMYATQRTIGNGETIRNSGFIDPHVSLEPFGIGGYESQRLRGLLGMETVSEIIE